MPATLQLPKEHGFWVMLGTSLCGAVLRTRGAGFAMALAVLSVLVVAASFAPFRRRVRREGVLQLGTAVGLAFAGAPVEAAGGLSGASIVAGALLRTVVFVASVCVARAALATSAKNGRARSAVLYLAAAANALAGATWFSAGQRPSEALGAALTFGAVLLCAWWRPTAKDLKPLGLYLTGLAIVAAVLPLLP